MCSKTTHKTREFCKLNILYELIKGNLVPDSVYGKWVSKGHLFKCIHPNPIYIIFLD